MQSKPSRVNGYWEGAKAIFDDYQGLHISQTEYIHLCVSVVTMDLSCAHFCG
jgi:hypothetical protein